MGIQLTIVDIQWTTGLGIQVTTWCLVNWWASLDHRVSSWPLWVISGLLWVCSRSMWGGYPVDHWVSSRPVWISTEPWWVISGAQWLSSGLLWMPCTDQTTMFSTHVHISFVDSVTSHWPFHATELYFIGYLMSSLLCVLSCEIMSSAGLILLVFLSAYSYAFIWIQNILHCNIAKIWF